jgi:multidrug efflux pump subunit AcrA (membrane-fusion protein)
VARDVAIAVIVLMLVGGCGGSHQDKDKGKGKKGSGAVPVVVAKSEVRDVPVVLNGIGTVTPLSVVEVKVRRDVGPDRSSAI